MRISHGTRINDQEQSNGYGYATAKMLESLAELGYEVNKNDPTADVEIWFDQPQHWKFSPGTYKIGYHPWESTLLLPGWAELMNECDEIWTPSPLIADWYRRHAGITVPVYVYEHGVDKHWTPVKREVDGIFKFLNVGAEASRKGGKDTIDAYRKAFGYRTDVELNLKMISDGWKIGRLRQINILNERLSLQELIQLFHDNHVYVYPSWGEGFGLTPIQAMATAMPTITLPSWAPYAQYLDPKLMVSSKMFPTQWPTIHPGLMFKPSQNSLVESMLYAYENYDEVKATAAKTVAELTDYYDWTKLTETAFSALEKRLKKI